MADFQIPRANEAETVSGDKTLDAGDAGVAQVVEASAVLTFPTSAAANLGATYIIVCGGEGETTNEIDITLRPNSADKFSGYGITAAADKDLVLTNGNSGVDFLVVTSNGATGGTWQIQAGHGTWVRES